MPLLQPEEIIRIDIRDSKKYSLLITVTLLSAGVLGFALGFFTGFALR